LSPRERRNLVAGRAYLAGRGGFPERAALNLIGGRFLTDFYAMVADWALWATKIVETWPDDPRGVPLDLAEQRASLRVAERIADLTADAAETERDAAS
jgi:hypothetical protein